MYCLHILIAIIKLVTHDALIALTLALLQYTCATLWSITTDVHVSPSQSSHMAFVAFSPFKTYY